MAAGEVVLFGPVSIDRWVAEGVELPGGGAFNIAAHWAGHVHDYRLLSRIGSADGAVLSAAVQRLGIPVTSTFEQPGASASIDVEIRDDRQPRMDRFQPGVWTAIDLDDADRDSLTSARGVHAVMVDPVIDVLLPMCSGGHMATVEVSMDLLDVRHLSAERLIQLMAVADIVFVGWPGDVTD